MRYFPGLNAIRFYLAMSVLIGHIPGYAFGIDIRNDLGTGWFILTGHDSVSAFFVLSGYLISYILLDEKRQTGTISQSRFAWRRSLRIFPLYFIVIALTALLYPQYMPPASAMPAFFLLSAHLVIPYIESGILWMMWSIGVEEWFYVAWPPLLRRFSILHVAATIIAIRILLGLLFFPQGLGLGFEGIYMSNADAATNLFRFLRFECMAIGGVFAWIVINRHWTLRLIYKFDKLTIALAVIVIAFFEGRGGMFYDVVLSLIFINVIVNAATNPRSLLRHLETPLTKQLGNLAYGLYLLHPMITVAVTSLFLDRPLTVTTTVLLYSSVICANVGVAALSYRFIEYPFLRLKDWRPLRPQAGTVQTRIVR